MPEGDTVYKIAGYLRSRILALPLAAGSAAGGASIPGGAGRSSDLAGRRIVEITTHGKHLFLRFSDGVILRSHLGMHGSWHRYPEGAPWRKAQRRASIELHVAGQVYVCFDAEEIEWLGAGSLRARQIRSRLGPDLLAPEVDLDAIASRAREILAPEDLAVDLLLDQRIASGIGNVYKSEVLFLAGVHPRLPLGEMADPLIRDLFGTARRLLQHNTGGGPRRTRLGLLPSLAYGGARRADLPGTRLWVYGRLGRPCLRCATAILHQRMGRAWRSTWWCPACQPDSAPEARMSGSMPGDPRTLPGAPPA